VKWSGNQFEIKHKSKGSCRKSKTAFNMCNLTPSCMNHLVCNVKLVARRWGTEVLCNMQIALTVHCLFKENSP
jgi:hypothetical protein